MNPFENTIESSNNNFLKDNNLIEIWSQERGRKIDTFISGLPYTVAELNMFLKEIKKKKACNGSIKEITKADGTYMCIHVQGNLKEFLKDYFRNLGIENIKLKA
jgi:translation initiation factor 1 (eIF-1/SUI1)